LFLQKVSKVSMSNILNHWFKIYSYIISLSTYNSKLILEFIGNFVRDNALKTMKSIPLEIHYMENNI
jgi:hypothetical protein